MIFAAAMFFAKKSIELEAPAKINLFLDVLGTRDDGYHDILSALVPVSLCDKITMEMQDGGIEAAFECGDVDDMADLERMDSGRNLAVRAAEALKAKTGHEGGARITIKKNIPVGGGLGGGSGNAAAVLVGLNELWGTDLSKQDLMEVGSMIGCDVPAMTHGGAVIVEGTGEKVSSVNLQNGGADGWWLVLANPGVAVSTKDIYSRYRPSLTSADGAFKNMVFSLETGDVSGASRALFNGLQSTVTRKYPLIGIMLSELDAAGAIGTLVSGSGATVFGLARDAEHARGVEAEFKNRLDGAVWTRVAKTMPDGVMVAHGPLEA